MSQPDSSSQTSPEEWGKFSLIAIRNRHSARLSISLGLNKGLDCCAQKQRSPLHDYATSQSQYLPTILFGGGEGQLSLCLEQKCFFQWHGNEEVYGATMPTKQTFLLCAFIVTSCLQWDNSTINQWQCTTVPKPAINNCEQCKLLFWCWHDSVFFHVLIQLTPKNFYRLFRKSGESFLPFLVLMSQESRLMFISSQTQESFKEGGGKPTSECKTIKDISIGRVPRIAVEIHDDCTSYNHWTAECVKCLYWNIVCCFGQPCDTIESAQEDVKWSGSVPSSLLVTTAVWTCHWISGPGC